MKILVYRTGRLGDFITAIPALNLIRKAYPGAHIVLLTCASSHWKYARKTWNYADPNRDLPWLELIIPTVIDEALTFESLFDFRRLNQIRKNMRQKQITASFFLPFSKERFANRLKKWIFLRFLGIKGPIYGLRPGSRPLFSTVPPLHQGDVALDIVRQAPAVAASRVVGEFDLHIPKAAATWAGEQWQLRGWKGCQVIAVFVGGTYAHKRWPSERFSAVCSFLYAFDSRRRFLFIGSGFERAWADEASAAVINYTWNACGETSLIQLAALLQGVQLYVGNDSGPAHLAASLGVPCVVCMSAIHPPGIWEPRGAPVDIQRINVPCQYCGCETHCPAKTRACIDGISIERVVFAVQNIIQSN